MSRTPRIGVFPEASRCHGWVPLQILVKRRPWRGEGERAEEGRRRRRRKVEEKWKEWEEEEVSVGFPRKP